MREATGITNRILSKELRDFELNHLVERKLYDTFPVTVAYTKTEYGETLKGLIASFYEWGSNPIKMKLNYEKEEEKINSSH
ncbi:winged helix-turn-helix transcriptional regulator [Algoriphagus lutimaris]|uniref:winged helix-turn-helix transcriptional regulator n=1 Tax=Algoriphagus lutimaris TaxID=613197 RepID=UPI00196A9D2F|nr:winged helix-turn-helix transcriptional regulator [Algoriphagus lutimaris]MBN3518954.1 winged helix-turn-helix transcriptional regulator [Algoriphagus lutimaris]